MRSNFKNMLMAAAAALVLPATVAAVAALAPSAAAKAEENLAKKADEERRVLIDPYVKQARDTLVVPEGQTVYIPGGVQDFKHLRMEKNATLIISNSGDILVAKADIAEGARIIVQPSLGGEPQKNITLYIFDASGVKELKIIADGARKDAEFPPFAASGKRGRTGNLLKLRESSRGKPGADGVRGADGGHAANVVIIAHEVRYGTLFDISAIGAGGQKGQGAGAGGRGGGGDTLVGSSSGGRAGLRGRGGDSGNAGQVVAYITPEGASGPSTSSGLPEYIRFEVRTASGKPGDQGDLADGGEGGRLGDLSFQGGVKSGKASRDAEAAKEGIGPRTHPELVWAAAYLGEAWRERLLLEAREMRRANGEQK